jgi:hypothetical protein
MSINHLTMVAKVSKSTLKICRDILNESPAWHFSGHLYFIDLEHLKAMYQAHTLSKLNLLLMHQQLLPYEIDLVSLISLGGITLEISIKR